ncbi:MAG: SUMF1/EgtB/PvdO family nonheme iron enzyme [Cyanobacteria bacterium P01_F01_bin.53]
MFYASESGDKKVLRGGAWGNSPRLCRSAFRFSFSPGHRDYYYVGFRVSCSTPRTQ